MWVPFAASATVATIGAVAKFVLPVVAIRPIPIPSPSVGADPTRTTTTTGEPTGDVGVWYTFAPPTTNTDGSASPQHRVSIPLSIFYPIDKTTTTTTPTTTTTSSTSSWLPHDNDIRYANGLASYASIPKFIFRRLRSHTLVATTSSTPDAPFPVDLKALSHDRVILFSHGLGGHRNMYSALCMSMAARGYVVIAMEHCDGSACCAVPLYTPFTSSPTSAAATNPLTVSTEETVDHHSHHRQHHHQHHNKAFTIIPYMRPPVLEPHTNKSTKTSPPPSSDDGSAASTTTTKTHAELQESSDLHFREKQLGERLTDVENIADAIRTKNLLGPLFGEQDVASAFATSASLQMVGHSFGGATVVGAAARAVEAFRNNNASSSTLAQNELNQKKATVGGMPLLGFTALDVWLWPAKSLSDRIFINPAQSQSPTSPLLFSPDSATATSNATSTTASTAIPFSAQFIDSEQWERWSENRNAIKELVETINNSSTSPTQPPATEDADGDAPAAGGVDAVAVVTPPRAVRHYTPNTDHLAASDMALFLTLGIGRKKYVDCKRSSPVIGEWAGLILSQK